MGFSFRSRPYFSMYPLTEIQKNSRIFSIRKTAKKRRVRGLLLLTESPGSWKGAQKNHRRWPWSFAPNVFKKH